ncbi:hypothetical protein [Sulfurospirillum deleyianum]|uniref:Uncharacterized protein n=1 Tax=Sulfurospirillum deleyianum (strain ATCC 51133 / DSM 6946 / 5175) TaxID=525898 RepID=D1B3A6_SULD5|nr:hypothetical protein [Sulfurospirillum deleyianum]ACZ12576.1 conserved hypothetical protein [Sulfurospirillum deleyianum DSM 6946]
MKKSMVVMACLCLSLMAQGKNENFVIHDLVTLEMPGGAIKSGALELNGDQMIRISKEVRPIMHERYQAKMNEAFGLEKRVQKLLKQGKSKEELKTYLDQISTIKREAMDIKIDAYKTFQAILTPEQWQKYLALGAQKN